LIITKRKKIKLVKIKKIKNKNKKILPDNYYN
jgi:hypothetical protein